MTPAAREHVNVQLLIAELLEQVPLPDLLGTLEGIGKLDDAAAMTCLRRTPYAAGFLLDLANRLLRREAPTTPLTEVRE